MSQSQHPAAPSSQSPAPSDTSLLTGFGSRPHGSLVHSMQKPQIGSISRGSIISRVKNFLDEAPVDVAGINAEPDIIAPDDECGAAGAEPLAVEMNLALGVFEQKSEIDQREEVRAYGELMESLMGKGEGVEDDEEQGEDDMRD